MSKGQRDLRQEVLGFVVRFCEDNGYAPTCDEIRESLGMSSKSHAGYYLFALENVGFTERKPRTPRGLRVVDASLITH